MCVMVLVRVRVLVGSKLVVVGLVDSELAGLVDSVQLELVDNLPGAVELGGSVLVVVELVVLHPIERTGLKLHGLVGSSLVGPVGSVRVAVEPNGNVLVAV